MIKVKICGMTNRDDIEAAIEMGADALGFNLFHESPRYVGPDALPELTSNIIPFVQRIAVVVDFSLNDIQRLDDQWHFPS